MSARHLTLLVHWSVVAATTMASCQSTKGAKMKSVASNVPEEQRTIVYAEGGLVLGKICSLPVTLPLQRICAGEGEPKSLPIDEFMNKIPMDTGDYSRDAEGLSEADADIKAAQDRYAQGNVGAVTILENLRPIKANLQRLLKIRDDMESQHKSFTLKATPTTFPLLWKAFEVPESEDLQPSDIATHK